jgi:hypothetical protein
MSKNLKNTIRQLVLEQMRHSAPQKKYGAPIDKNITKRLNIRTIGDILDYAQIAINSPNVPIQIKNELLHQLKNAPDPGPSKDEPILIDPSTGNPGGEKGLIWGLIMFTVTWALLYEII